MMPQPSRRGALTLGVLDAPRGLRIVAGNLGEPAMQALAKLVGRILTLRTTLARHNDTRRRDPGQPRKPEELPTHAHSRVG
jgi:hypothetical protein